MAKSKVGGVFGMLSGKVGSAVYRTTNAALDGGTTQVVAQKPTSVKNPNTVSQIIQRMKVGPAQKFYDAFEKVVENGIMSHSWEGVPYGNKSRLRFLQLAMSGDVKAYAPKGYTGVTPGVYQVSEGSLPEVKVTETDVLPSVESIISLGTDSAPISATAVSRLLAAGLQLGDQVTCVATVYNSSTGKHEAVVASLIVNEGAIAEYSGNNSIEYEAVVAIGEDGKLYFSDPTNLVSSFAVIISRGRLSSNAKRSNATMQLTQAYAGLMSAEAFQAAIDSYITGVGVNDLNSTWYLNQNGGATQAVDAQIVGIRFDGIKLGDGEQAETFSETIMAMRRLVGNQLSYFYLTSDGTATGKVMSIESMDAPIEINKTLSELRQYADFPAAAGYSKATSMLLKQYNSSTNRPIINATQKNA